MGSNVAPRRRRISEAIGRLGSIARIISESEPMESPDITGRGNSYVNMAVMCDTDLSMAELLDTISGFEKAGGRAADSRESGVVHIDIDLVVWDGEIASPFNYSATYFTPLFRQLKGV